MAACGGVVEGASIVLEKTLLVVLRRSTLYLTLTYGLGNIQVIMESLVQLEAPEGKTFRVGDLSKRTGKTVRALHLYEERGLLEPAARSEGGYRLYDERAVTRVRWIAKLQELGFTLSEVRLILQRWEESENAPEAMRDVTQLYEEKLAETLGQIDRLQQLADELRASLEYLTTCDTCDPDRLVDRCGRCELHPEDAPGLVAGFGSAPTANGNSIAK